MLTCHLFIQYSQTVGKLLKFLIKGIIVMAWFNDQQCLKEKGNCFLFTEHWKRFEHCPVSAGLRLVKHEVRGVQQRR